MTTYNRKFNKKITCFSLSEKVCPPRIVHELSWATNYWPEETGDTRTFIKPEVQKYCLMSVKGSYTDFHVDFGGTSVWYNIVRVSYSSFLAYWALDRGP